MIFFLIKNKSLSFSAFVLIGWILCSLYLNKYLQGLLSLILNLHILNNGLALNSKYNRLGLGIIQSSLFVHQIEVTVLT